MIDQMNAKLRDVYTEPPVLRRKEGGTQVSGPRELLDAVFASAARVWRCSATRVLAK
jgi:DNA gyrase subunit B